MTNLTISIEEPTLKKARIRALEQGTSVNAVVKDFLMRYAGVGDIRRQAAERILALSRHATSRSGGRRWSRDEIHDR